MKHVKLISFSVDGLCAFLMAAGAALVLLPFWGFPLGQGAAVLLAALGVGLFALSGVRRWLPFGLLLLGALPAPLLALFGRGKAVWAYLGGLFPWALSGAPEDPRYPGAGSLYLAAFLLMLPVGLLCWLLFHRLRSLWAVTAAALVPAVLGAVYVPERALFGALLPVFGVIVFLPAAGKGKKEPVRAQLIAALFMLPIAVLALAMGPKTDGQWYSMGVRHAVNDLRDLWEYHFGGSGQGYPGVGRLGLSPLGDRLGGDVDLGSELIFMADGTEPFLLRSEALEYYTGSGWGEPAGRELGSFRFGSLLFSGERKRAFGLDRGENLPVSSYGIRFPIDTEIMARANYRTLFLPYRTREIAPGVGLGDEVDVYFDLQGEAWLSTAADGIYSYRVQADAWNVLSPEFDLEVLRALAAMPLKEDAYYADAAATCLQLPDTLPDWVGDLTEEITAGIQNPYRKAMALRDYLRETCTYTTSPGAPDPEEDFVAAFLRDRQGYCTYYATALTVMCRLSGVPARYVKGYAMVYDRGTGRLRATGATAHAWTEIYLSHLGWVPVDAVGETLFGLPRETVIPPAAEPTPTPLPETTPAPEEVLMEETAPKSGVQALWLLALLPLLGLIPLGMGYYPRRYAPRRVFKKRDDPADAADFYDRALRRQLRLWGVTPAPGETLRQFFSRGAEALAGDAPAGFDAVAPLLERLRYGGQPPTREEAEALGETVLLLEARLKSRLGRGGYFSRAVAGTLLFHREDR